MAVLGASGLKRHRSGTTGQKEALLLLFFFFSFSLFTLSKQISPVPARTSQLCCCSSIACETLAAQRGISQPFSSLVGVNETSPKGTFGKRCDPGARRKQSPLTPQYLAALVCRAGLSWGTAPSSVPRYPHLVSRPFDSSSKRKKEPRPISEYRPFILFYFEISDVFQALPWLK